MNSRNKSKYFIALCLFLSSCSQDQDQKSQDKAFTVDLNKPSVSEQLSDNEKQAVQAVVTEQMQRLGSTAATIPPGPNYSPEAVNDSVDSHMTPFPQERPYNLQKIVFYSAGIGGLLAVIFQQFYRYRNPLPARAWEIARSSGLAFLAGGVCSSALMFIALSSPSRTQAPYTINNYFLLNHPKTSASNSSASTSNKDQNENQLETPKSDGKN